MSYKFFRQLNTMDCGPTCLKVIAYHYNINISIEKLREKTGFNKEGVTMFSLIETANDIGFEAEGVFASIEALKNQQLPCILHWEKNHFVVLIQHKRKKWRILDPAKGIINYTESEFFKKWAYEEDGEVGGNAILLERDNQKTIASTITEEKNKTIEFFLQYFKLKKYDFLKVFFSLILISIIQLIFPFLTQAIVDTGIGLKDMNFISLILIAQLLLIFSRTISEFIRSRILLRLSISLNVQLLSNFWNKLTRLPISYFDVRHTGDTFQRIEDQKEIQNFISGNSVSTFFSIFQFVIYAIILCIYKLNLFFVFVIGSVLYLSWIIVFLKVRRKINNEMFALASKENSITIELIQGMQEIRLNNAEQKKQSVWQEVQKEIFRLNFKSLNYSQIQEAGAVIINECQGFIMSFIVAYLVVKDELTLGAMLAIQFIIGQLSSPIKQWVSFIQEGQSAKISLERLKEIEDLDDEERPESTVKQLSKNKSIQIVGLNFRYPGAEENTLNEINIHIPENKVTAIVGSSGSGKTTLIKLLLKIYEKYSGSIELGDAENSIEFQKINHAYWRSLCGAVLQDGYIFDDTILNNIITGAQTVDINRIKESCRIACIDDYIEALPNKYNTKIGADGLGLSQGQKQRILIARAIYKNPLFLFFDEATNSLDAKREKEIVENLDICFKGKTVIVVAHRLSTVRNADNIIVLEHGRIIEQGNHEYLIQLKGKYFDLVRNQLELGS